MRNSERFQPVPFIPAFLAAMLAFMAMRADVFAHDLKDISLITAAGQTHLKLSFDRKNSEGEYPLYFQKTDLAKGTLTLSFLETETEYPLGRHLLDAKSPALEEILLKKITSPSGKNFLGVELKLRQAPTGDAAVQPAPKGVLKVMLGKGKGKYSWSLGKALKSDDAYLSAKAESPPASAAAPIPTSPPAKPEAAALNSSETNDGMKSAHEEGLALEGREAGKGLSSSRIFSVDQGGKPMVLLKDSAALKSAPGPKGKLIRKIPLGGKVERIGSKGKEFKVVSGTDTGFIKASEAVYADELTAAQEKDIQKRITAKQTKMEAAIAKAEAAKAKAEALAIKAEEAALKKAEADSLKAQKGLEAKAQLAQKKAEAKALAAQKKLDAQALAAQKKADAEALAAKKKADIEAAKLAKEMAKQEKALKLQEAQAQARQAAAQTAAAKANPDMNAGAAPPPLGGPPKLAIGDNPELAAKLAQEKIDAEDEKKRIEPEERRVAYNSYGRRDPFIPVEQGASDIGIDIDQMKVVGIIWQSSQPMAVLEHNREAGVSFTVKEGDPVHNGRVSRISKDAVTFDISEYGISRSYSLKLVTSREGVKK